MKCPKCGETSRIREKDKFCHHCGANLTGEVQNETVDNENEVDVLIKELSNHIIGTIFALSELIKARNSENISYKVENPRELIKKICEEN